MRNHRTENENTKDKDACGSFLALSYMTILLLILQLNLLKCKCYLARINQLCLFLLELDGMFKTKQKSIQAELKVELSTENEKVDLTSSFQNTKVLFTVSDRYKAFQKSTAEYFSTPRIITALVAIMVGLMMLPIDRKSRADSPIWCLIYLGSVSAHFGAQVWMTFVSGLSLFFALPRHTFGNVQKVLFPKYFLLNSILSLITLYVFLRSHNYHLYATETVLQVTAMTLCFLIELFIRFYLTPPLLKLITLKTQIEAQVGVGMEVGNVVPGELLNCPRYITVHKAFRKMHMTIAIGNITTIACTVLHLHYLSQKMCGL